MMKKLCVCVWVLALCFSLTGCGAAPENHENSSKESSNIYGTVEQITVFDSIDQFNVEISENNKRYFANNDYMVAENGLYWYRLYEDITCYVKPVAFTGDISKDVTATIALRYDVDSKNEPMALEYVRYLIQSNNPNLSEEEVSELMGKAQEQAAAGTTAHNGKGITVGVLITDTTVEYQIVRLYDSAEK